MVVVVGGVDLFLGGMSKFLAGGGGRNPIRSSRENPMMCYFCVYMIHHSCLYDSAKTACLGKIFLTFYTKLLSTNQIARFVYVLISQKLFEV